MHLPSTLCVLLLNIWLTSPGDFPHPPQTAGWQSHFGIDYIFPLMPFYQRPIWPQRLAETGARWVNFAMVSWARLQPHSPRRGIADYHWQELDQAIRWWQQYGFHITISLRLQNGWFAGPRRYTPQIGNFLLNYFLYRQSDRLPAARYMSTYRQFIRSLVERYDGDGYQDMPGLRWPVRHYQVGNEYANPLFWSGTIADYAVLLLQTRQAARQACKEVQIISNGIRWNDLFHNDPQAQRFEAVFTSFLRRLPSAKLRNVWQHARLFTEKTIALAPYYEILDAGGNGPYYTASAGYMTWVRQRLAQAAAQPQIWDMEARCEPQLIITPHCCFHPALQVPGGRQILAALKRPGHPRHQQCVAWYRAEQARILAKVLVTRFAAGFSKVFMGMASDWDAITGAKWSTPNVYMGLVDAQARPWPAFYTLQLLVQQLDGFGRAQAIPAGPQVALYRFTFKPPRPAVWVVWLRESQVRGLADPLPGQHVLLRAIKNASLIRTIPIRATPNHRTEYHPASRTGLRLFLTPTPLLIQER